jgi:hypothetical protein
MALVRILVDGYSLLYVLYYPVNAGRQMIFLCHRIQSLAFLLLISIQAVYAELPKPPFLALAD